VQYPYKKTKVPLTLSERCCSNLVAIYHEYLMKTQTANEALFFETSSKRMPRGCVELRCRSWCGTIERSFVAKDRFCTEEANGTPQIVLRNQYSQHFGKQDPEEDAGKKE
jgi:hypothetical protein